MTQRLKWAFLFGVAGCLAGCNPTVAATPAAHASRATFTPGCGRLASPDKPCYMPSGAPAVTPQPVTARGMTAVAFADSLHGWSVGASCSGACTVELSTTTDGGSTWSSPRTVGVVRPPEGETLVSPAIRFVGQDGWIFGPGIFETHDGGATWRQAALAPILALEPYANTVWAMEGCASAESSSCPIVMLESQPGSDTWRPAPVQPPIPGGTVVHLTAPLAMERAAGGATFLAVTRADRSQGLYVTRDLGKSWSTLSAPCDAIVSVRSLDSQRVWILCAAGCCTGNWLKSVYVSSDGGVSWTEQAQAGFTTKGSIPFGGSAESLIVTSQTTALFGASGNAGVWRTTDSGVTWTPVLTADCFRGGEPVSELWFVDALHGWALIDGGVGSGCPPLVRTTDGGLSWAPIASPFPTSLH